MQRVVRVIALNVVNVLAIIDSNRGCVSFPSASSVTS